MLSRLAQHEFGVVGLRGAFGYWLRFAGWVYVGVLGVLLTLRSKHLWAEKGKLPSKCTSSSKLGFLMSSGFVGVIVFERAAGLMQEPY